MSTGALIQTAEQEEYPHPLHRRFFLRDVVTALENQDLSVHRGRIEVGGEILPHPHTDRTETFYILSGEALCTLGNAQYQVRAGSCCVAPAGMIHGLRNTGEEPVELLALFTPPLK